MANTHEITSLCVCAHVSLTTYTYQYANHVTYQYAYHITYQYAYHIHLPPTLTNTLTTYAYQVLNRKEMTA